MPDLANISNGSSVGVSGKIIDDLVKVNPKMIPVKAWGARLGWRSERRHAQWRRLIEETGHNFKDDQSGLLIRFVISADEWVPHPYAPPGWTTKEFSTFSRYIVNSAEAFELSRNWQKENSVGITNQLKKRLKRYSVDFGANYFCFDKTDYCDVAFIVHGIDSDAIQIKMPWKSESELATLVSNIYPGVLREYSPPWLGDQRIDIFVPSINVAFEYQGEQHYHPVEFFGGKEGYDRTRKRDYKKRILCKNNNMILVEWPYNIPITIQNLKEQLSKHGIFLPDVLSIDDMSVS